MLIGILDRELEPVLEAIYLERAETVADARLQFQFVLDLLRREADDLSSVLRHRDRLQMLADRYFPDHENEHTALTSVMLPKPALALKGQLDEGFLNEAILDCLPDRIAVVTTDYRYLYTNPVNAARLDEKPMDLVGRHLIEFIGLQRFEQRAKPNLDRCFAGESVDYTFAKEMERRTVVVRCRMSPCTSSTGKVIGAIVMLQEIADRRRAVAA